jgi:hypothetical protein
MTFIARSEITGIVPILIQLLSNELTFIGASDVLQEILTTSPLSDGSGTKTLTEPLFTFLEGAGSTIVQNMTSSTYLRYYASDSPD